MFCVHCGVALPGTARFCNQCGKPVSAGPAGFKCPGCGDVIPSRESPCPKCGSRPVHCLQCGRMLTDSKFFCPDCKTLTGVSPAYQLQPREFEHPSMQQMNQMLRHSTGLNSMAQMISKKVGKPWYESLFNSVLTSESQYPRIFELAGIAARRIGLKKMPSVYVEADRGYQSATYGSDQDSFLNIGTFLPRLLNDRELLFVLGHELGHLVSNHALWTTVSMFLVGQHRSSVMSEGIIQYLTNPFKVVEQGMESVISSWMRVSDLTADRAALLVVGDFEVAKRVLFLLYFKSRRELQDVNLDEWVRQQMSQEAGAQKLSEFGSPTPYLGTRLRELNIFYDSPRYTALRKQVESGCGLEINDLFDDKGALRKKENGGKNGKPEEGVSLKIPAAKGISCRCPKCETKLSVQLKKVPEHRIVKISCPTCKGAFSLDLARVPGPLPKQVEPPQGGNPDVRAETAKKQAAAPARETAPRGIAKRVRGKCPKCGAAFSVPLEKLPDKPAVELRCNGCRQKFRLVLSGVKEELAQTDSPEDDPT